MNIQTVSFDHYSVPSDLFFASLQESIIFSLLACLLNFCLFIETNVPLGPMRIGAEHPFTVTQCSKTPMSCTKYFHLPPHREWVVFTDSKLT